MKFKTFCKGTSKKFFDSNKPITIQLKKILKNLYFKNLINSSNNLTYFLFYISLFLLPSAFSISAIFLIICLILSSINNIKNFLEDKLNICFLFATTLLIISSIMHNFKNNYLSYDLNSSFGTVYENIIGKFILTLVVVNCDQAFSCVNV